MKTDRISLSMEILKIKHIINRLLFVLDKYMPIFHGDVVLGHVYYHVTETAVGYPWYNFY